MQKILEELLVLSIFTISFSNGREVVFKTTDFYGEITSLNYPNEPPLPTFDIWVINIVKGNTIELIFHTFDVTDPDTVDGETFSCFRNYILINIDGVKSVYCNTKHPSLPRTDTASKIEIIFRYERDSDIQGFNATFQITTKIKTTTSATEATTTETSAIEETKTEAITTEAATIEINTTEAITTNKITTKATTTTSSTTEATRKEATTTKATTTEANTIDATITEKITTKTPTSALNTAEGATTKASATEPITTVPNTTELTTTEASTTEATTTEKSTTKATTTNSSATEATIREENTTKASTTEESTTEARMTISTTTEVNTTEASVKASNITHVITTEVKEITTTATTPDSGTIEATTASIRNEVSTIEANTTESMRTEARTTEATTTEDNTTELTITETRSTKVNANTTLAITTEANTTEATKTEARTTEAKTMEINTTKATTTEASAIEATMTETITTKSPTSATNIAEGATTKASTTEPTTTVGSTTEVTTTDSSTTEPTTTEENLTEATTTDTSSTEAIGTEKSTTRATTTTSSKTEATISEANITKAPTTESSTTEARMTISTTTEVHTTKASIKASNMTHLTTTDVMENTTTATTSAITTEASTIDANTTDETTTEDNTTESTRTEARTTEATTTEDNTTDLTITETRTTKENVNTTLAITTEANTSKATTTKASTGEATITETRTIEETTTTSSTTEATIREPNITETTTTDTNTTKATTTNGNTTEATIIMKTTTEATTLGIELKNHSSKIEFSTTSITILLITIQLEYVTSNDANISWTINGLDVDDFVVSVIELDGSKRNTTTIINDDKSSVKLSNLEPDMSYKFLIKPRLKGIVVKEKAILFFKTENLETVAPTITTPSISIIPLTTTTTSISTPPLASTTVPITATSTLPTATSIGSTVLPTASLPLVLPVPNIRSEFVNSDTANISWTPTTQNIDGYYVSVIELDGFKRNTTVFINPERRSVKISNLNPDTPYKFVIKPRMNGKLGEEASFDFRTDFKIATTKPTTTLTSDPTTATKTTTITPSTKIRTLPMVLPVSNIRLEFVSSNTANISWTPTEQNIDGYYVSVIELDGFKRNTTAFINREWRSVKISNLDPNTPYQFVIKPRMNGKLGEETSFEFRTDPITTTTTSTSTIMTTSNTIRPPCERSGDVQGLCRRKGTGTTYHPFNDRYFVSCLLGRVFDCQKCPNNLVYVSRYNRCIQSVHDPITTTTTSILMTTSNTIRPPCERSGNVQGLCRRKGTGTTHHPFNDRYFVSCLLGCVLSCQKCPNNLLYVSRCNRCIRSVNAGCSGQPNPSTTTRIRATTAASTTLPIDQSPTVTQKLSCPDICSSRGRTFTGNTGNPNNPKQFVQCVFGRSYGCHLCPGILVFNPNGYCDWPSK